jgi:aquaporin Z
VYNLLIGFQSNFLYSSGISKTIIMKKYITEFVGTFFLLTGAIFAGGMGASLALITMVYAGGHISGAHYNPAVSFGMWLRGKIDRTDLFLYSLFQVLAALSAGALAFYFFEKEGAGSCVIAPDASTKGILAELIGTFALVYVVLNVATTEKTAGNSYFGLAIGLTVLAMATIFGSLSGGVFNPAVFVGLCIQNSLCWDQWWMYLVGQFGGAAIAAALFSYQNPTDKD